MDERDYKAMNKHENGNEVLAVVSCWAVLLQWTTGCEADAESTEVKAIFMTKQQADEYCKILKPKIKWHQYYQGCLEVEEVPFEPCS